ncbi:hypothetical protein NA56DRAFT_657812 [Hyaloscypha hepaticicola]|uniref:Uncharacterized protein n=1 Tax=Hyaloscypha hepaticicola TaxID=2082293 RepID=A0A2J6Q9Y2_9HELO|nr:hypothetical protein NA56DRAFT_657812 [Hyaloscypha hepaticicola]
MLPATLLIASLTLPWIAKSSASVCIPSAEGYQFDTFTTIYNSFCRDLSKEGFAVSPEVYGVPVVSLSFVPTTKANRCDQVTCFSTFRTLIQSCSMNNYSVWGTGSLDAGCERFNFTVTVSHSTLNSEGSATNAIGASATGTPVLLSLASTPTTTKKPTTKKPVVRSTAMGDSIIFPVSGASLLGVAFIFCFL